MKSTPSNQSNTIAPNYSITKLSVDKAGRANKEKDQNLLSGYTIDKSKIKYASNVVDTEDSNSIFGDQFLRFLCEHETSEKNEGNYRE